MVCHDCGHNVAADAKFCEQCGAPCRETIVARSESGPVKECPACHSTVELAQTICPNCDHRFGIDNLRQSAGGPQDKAAKVGCMLAIAALVVWALYSCVYESPEDIAARKAEAEAAATKQAEERRKGFHCLSGWDGSNASVVQQIKGQLRDPDSFEHEETRITPRDVKGDHMVTMTYRARNGFGGMNSTSALAVVNGESCEATVINTGDE